MQGSKTQEQSKRNLEHKRERADPIAPARAKQTRNPKARQSEFPVSQQGMNQESEHNKHNNPAQGARKH